MAYYEQVPDSNVFLKRLILFVLLMKGFLGQAGLVGLPEPGVLPARLVSHRLFTVWLGLSPREPWAKPEPPPRILRPPKGIDAKMNSDFGTRLLVQVSRMPRDA